MNVLPQDSPELKSPRVRKSPWHPSIFFHPLRLSETIATKPQLAPILAWALVSWWLHEPRWMLKLGVRLHDSHIYAVPTFLQGLLHHAVPWFMAFAVVAFILHLVHRRTANPGLPLETRWLATAALWSVPLTFTALARVVTEIFFISPDPFELPLEGLMSSPISFALKLGSYGLGALAVGWLAFRLRPDVDVNEQTFIPSLKAWHVALIVGGGALSAGVDVERNWHKVRPLQRADLAPEFNLKSLNGSARLNLESWAQGGGLTLIDFWATWCEPCKVAMPQIEALHEQHSAHGLRILSVNIESGEEEIVRDFMEKNPMPFDVWIDDDRMAARYDVSLYPTFVLLEDKRVVGIFEGLPGLVGVKSQIEDWIKTRGD